MGLLGLYRQSDNIEWFTITNSETCSVTSLHLDKFAFHTLLYYVKLTISEKVLRAVDITLVPGRNNPRNSTSFQFSVVLYLETGCLSRRSTNATPDSRVSRDLKTKTITFPHKQIPATWPVRPKNSPSPKYVHSSINSKSSETNIARRGTNLREPTSPPAKSPRLISGRNIIDL